MGLPVQQPPNSLGDEKPVVDYNEGDHEAIYKTTAHDAAERGHAATDKYAEFPISKQACY